MWLGNVAFGLRMQGMSAAKIAARVRETLALVDLSGFERRRVIELSGGEMQRVALARSLAPRPRLLMLDEPLGALDRALREQLMNDLRGILKRVGLTALYVTHDQSEAFAVADRVLIMRARPEAGEGGWIEQDGPPHEVYRHPADRLRGAFPGLQESAWQEPSLAPLGHADGQACGQNRTGRADRGTDTTASCPVTGAAVTVLVRPEAAESLPADAVGANIVPGRLLEASYRGSYYLIRTEHAAGIMLTCEPRPPWGWRCRQ